jgi:ABC-type dipeptide/oligopeptide/nickel transport system ATPase component
MTFSDSSPRSTTKGDCSEPLLAVRGLGVRFAAGTSASQPLTALHALDFDIHRGEVLALVGESGSGKSVAAMALTRLLGAADGASLSGSVHFAGQDLLAASEPALRRLRGKHIAYIFQEPSLALNPVMTIGSQIAESIKLHSPPDRQPRSRRALRAAVVAAMAEVGIADPASRCDDFPSAFSGGMQQRALIAMALAGDPDLLIADEPTTALDATTQRRIIDLLIGLRRSRHLALLFITHNLGLLPGFADRVLVLRHGRMVECAPTPTLLSNPQHAYTRQLLDAIPRLPMLSHHAI